MAPTEHLEYRHIFQPGSKGARSTLLLLHGTGGDERDLLPLGESLAPGAALLSPRGNVSENGMPRFFRRLAEGLFDQEDLAVRTEELNTFIEAAATHYGFPKPQLFAVGFSNGANIASSLLFRHPDAFAGAVLFRGMVPFEPEAAPNLSGKPILLLNGEQDPIVPRKNAEALESIFRKAKANVQVHWESTGHALTEADVTTARQWLQREVSRIGKSTKPV